MVSARNAVREVGTKYKRHQYEYESDEGNAIYDGVIPPAPFSLYLPASDNSTPIIHPRILSTVK